VNGLLMLKVAAATAYHHPATFRFRQGDGEAQVQHITGVKHVFNAYEQPDSPSSLLALKSAGGRRRHGGQKAVA